MLAWDAVVIAGGAGSRLGGASKPELVVGGVALVDRTLAAVAGARAVMLVGGPRREGVGWTVEDPPRSGPAAAVAAGVAALAAAARGGGVGAGAGAPAGPAPWTVVLGVDTPRAEQAVQALLTAREGDGGALVDGATSCDGVTSFDGAWLVDGEGREQPLVAVYRTRVLAAHAEGDLIGASLRRLVGGLAMIAVPDTAGLSRDLDTWDDARFWKETLG